MPNFTIDTTLPKNIPLLFKQRAYASPEVGLQAAKDKDGNFQTYTYQQVYKNVICFALALQKIGITSWKFQINMVAHNNPMIIQN